MPDTPNDPDAARDIAAVVEEAEKALRDGAYLTVGLAVLAFQRAQVQRRELARRLSPPASQWPGQSNGSGRSSGSEQRSGSGQPSGDGDRLAAQLDEIGRSLGANVDSARAQLLELVRSFDEWVAPARRQIDEQIDTVAELLPVGARGFVGAVRSAMAGPEARLRAAVGLD